jgi:hypothetical protein
MRFDKESLEAIYLIIKKQYTLMKIMVLKLFLICFIPFVSFSQDLIVTDEGESLNCKIRKLESNNIFFIYKHKEEIRKTFISLRKVEDYQYDYFEEELVSVRDVEDKIYGEYKHFHFALNVGYSYMINKTNVRSASYFKEYLKKLKSGMHISTDVYYFLTEQVGIGFKCVVFKSKKSEDDILFKDVGVNRFYIERKDNITNIFIGPALYTRLLNADKTNAFKLNFAFGYIDYKQNIIIVDTYKMTGNSVGFALDLGYDLRISNNVHLGFQISMISGNLQRYSFYDGEKTKHIPLSTLDDELFSVSHIDLSVGLKVNL